MAPELYLVASIVGGVFTLLALTAPRRPAFLSFPMFMAGWVAGDLALFHLAWQAVATIVFVALGALDERAGWIGLAISAVSWVGLVMVFRRQRIAEDVLEAALIAGLGDDYEQHIDPDLAGELRKLVPRRYYLSPFRVRDPEVERITSIAYGDHKRQRLDVYRRRDGVRPGNAPVLLQIHGGAWVVGDKRQQAQPLLWAMAARGWVCVAPNYRLSPKATFPDHLVDVKRALAWVREHAAEHGADPDFVVVTGGSAGGHLAALLALTPNDTRFQPGFENVNTSVAGCMPMYGVYDFLDRHGVRGKAAMKPFLERLVMKCSPVDERDQWEAASPISHVGPHAPPFFVVHGSHDSLVWIEDTRHFVTALREASREPVVDVELPHAQHAFDIMANVRSAMMTAAAVRWLEWARSRHHRSAATNVRPAPQPEAVA